jgi:hypothetical protein
MKKTIISAAFLFLAGIFSSSVSLAQKNSGTHGPENPVEVGTVLLNIGVGIGGNYHGDGYGTAFGIKAAAEFGLWQAGPGVITLGPEIGGSFSSVYPDSYNGNYSGHKASTFVIAGRAAWHNGWDVPGLDTYGGFSAGIGFHHYGYDAEGNYITQTIPVFGGFVGASYFISPTFGFNAEAGFDITNFQVGVVFKLK